MVSSSKASDQVSHQREQEERQEGMELELFDFQLCSAVKAEKDHLHPEPEMGETFPRTVTTPVQTPLNMRAFAMKRSCAFAIRQKRTNTLHSLLATHQMATARYSIIFNLLILYFYSLGLQVILGGCLVWMNDSAVTYAEGLLQGYLF